MPEQVTVRVELGPYVLRGREVEAAEVQQAVGEHARLELAFLRDPRAVASPVAALRVGELAGAGVRVVFVAEGGSECLAFEGRVRQASVDHLATGAGHVTVLAHSDSYVLAEHVDRQYFSDHTLAALAGRFGVRIDGELPASDSRDYMQPGVSAWAFLAEAAAQEGLQLRARWPRTPGGAADQAAELGRGFTDQTHTLTWGRELVRFATGLAPANSGVAGAFYDSAEKHDHRFRGVRAPAEYLGGAAPVVAAAQGVDTRDADGGDPGYVEPGRAVGVRARTLEEFHARLALESGRRAGGVVRARGASVLPALRAGDRVQIQAASIFGADVLAGELDDRTGLFGLMAVTHRWTGSLYENAFTATPWAGYHPAPAAVRAAGLAAAGVASRGVGRAPGATVAVVTDNADPKHRGRVRVRFAHMSEGEQSQWIRVAGLGGGNTRGLGALPSVGDEVVVAPVAGDPEHPVVLGALWNGVDGASHDPERQVWITPAGNTLVFLEAGEGGAETVELHSPEGKAWVQLAQKGPGGVPTVSVHSEGDLSLEAPHGEIRIAAKTYVAQTDEGHATKVGGAHTTKVQGAVTVESAARLSMKAGADFVLVAGGGALQVHAAGVSTVVGSRVTLNPPGAGAPGVSASVPALARSAWGARPVPPPGPGRSTEDPKTPTQQDIAARAACAPAVTLATPSSTALEAAAPLAQVGPVGDDPELPRPASAAIAPAASPSPSPIGIDGVPPQLVSPQLALPHRTTTHTLEQIRRMRQPDKWRAAELYVRELCGAGPERSFQATPGAVAGLVLVGTGERKVDAPVDTNSGGVLAVEVKAYYQWRTVRGDPNPRRGSVDLSRHIQQEILKDVWLRDNVVGYDPRWLFLEAPPSPELSAELARNRIISVQYHEPVDPSKRRRQS